MSSLHTKDLPFAPNQAAIDEMLDRIFGRMRTMPAQTVDVTTNGITSKVRAASLALPALAPQPLPEKTSMTDAELRAEILRIILRAPWATADGARLVAEAQIVYDWVTQQKQAAIDFPPTPVVEAAP